MTNKLNTKQRQVVLNRAAGMYQTDAYQAVYGCDRSSAERQASHLFTRNKLAIALLNQLLERKEQLSLEKTVETVLSATEKRAILANIARASMVDFQDEDGEPQLTKDTPNAGAAKEYYHRRRTVGRGKDKQEIVTKSIKLLDPISAIQEDNRMAGHYAPSKHLVASYNVSVSLKAKNRHEDETDTT